VFSWLPSWARWSFPLVVVLAIAAFVVSARFEDAEDAVTAARQINPCCS